MLIKLWLLLLSLKVNWKNQYLKRSLHKPYCIEVLSITLKKNGKTHILIILQPMNFTCNQITLSY